MERVTQTRKSYIGKVVALSSDKTIKVLITTYGRDPKYGKRVFSTKKFTAHDAKNEAKLGDVVSIMECRPLSATKHFRLVKILAQSEAAMLAEEENQEAKAEERESESGHKESEEAKAEASETTPEVK